MFVIILLIVLGLIFGSFVNALVWRVHKQEALKDKKGVKDKAKRLRELSMLHGRSMCSKCHHRLVAMDLIPLFSWIWLGGKCRYCHQPIEDPPIVELAVPALFVTSYLLWPSFHGWELIQFYFWLVFIVGFVVLALFDLRWYILPDKIVYPLVGLALLELVVHSVFFGGGGQAVVNAAWGMLFASGIFFALYQLSRGSWIGGGDVKLGLVLGLLLGGPFRSLLLLFIASLLGTLVSLPLLVAGKAGRKTLISFGPFLLAATVIITLFGAAFVGWFDHFAG